MSNPNYMELFESCRPKLMGLAYRILSSTSDAEDAVQDTFLKWANADRSEIGNHEAWLTATCTRRCLDLLRAAHRARVNYVGAWLPEPVQTRSQNDAETSLELASSLKTAFLLMLERLSPKERAAYLLHEIFETPYGEIAGVLEIRESACRKLVSRARANIDLAKTRFETPVDRQDELLAAFHAAVANGETSRLETLLSEDIQLTADGGGKVPAILEPLHGKAAVLSFLAKRLHEYWADFRWSTVHINGERGISLAYQGHVHATVSFAFDRNGKAADIYIVRNPEKLENLHEISIH